MQVLIIGGTGLISRGIVKHLLARGVEVTVYNRAQRENTLPVEVKRLTGDRNRRPAWWMSVPGTAARRVLRAGIIPGRDLGLLCLRHRPRRDLPFPLARCRGRHNSS